MQEQREGWRNQEKRKIGGIEGWNDEGVKDCSDVEIE